MVTNVGYYTKLQSRLHPPFIGTKSFRNTCNCDILAPPSKKKKKLVIQFSQTDCTLSRQCCKGYPYYIWQGLWTQVKFPISKNVMSTKSKTCLNVGVQCIQSQSSAPFNHGGRNKRRHMYFKKSIQIASISMEVKTCC